MIVKPKGEPIYSESATIVEMMDEAAGPFIRIGQYGDSTERGEVRIERNEWNKIKEAVDTMLEVCMKEQTNMDIKEGKSK